MSPRRDRARPGARRAVFALWLAMYALAPWARGESPDSASDSARKGVENYRKQDYDQALVDFRQAAEDDPASAAIQYNLGTTLARKGEFDAASEALHRSIDYPGTPSERDSRYNMGYSLAERAEKVTSPDEKLKLLKVALESFRDAAVLDPKDLDARHNYELTHMRIKQIEEQMPPPQRDPSDKEGDENPDQSSGEQEQKEGGDEGEEGESDPGEAGPESEQQPQGGQPNQSEGEGSGKPNETEQGRGQNPQATPTPQPRDESKNEEQENQDENGEQGKGDASGGSSQGGARDWEDPLTPDQIDALKALDEQESKRPEEFKNFFRFRASGSKRLEKDW